MNNYQYTPFEEKSLDLVESYPKLLNEKAHKGVLELFVMHNYLQVRYALDGDYFDNRYADLSNAVNEASDALKSDNTAWQSMAMMRLGMAVGRMDRPCEVDTMKQEVARKRQSYPVDRRNVVFATLKEIAQKWASYYWLADKEQKIRTSKMADEYITPILADAIKSADVPQDYLPELNTIKEWIKPVAPEYAQKRGRPSKKKKYQ